MANKGHSRPSALSKGLCLGLLFLGLLLYATGIVGSRSERAQGRSPLSASSASSFRKAATKTTTRMSSLGAVTRGAGLRGAVTARIPAMLYGTAWKKAKTAVLVEKAVTAGFRAIDTACQPKHYHEPGVGEALEKLYKAGKVTRADMFLQTKFTSLSGQDPNKIPYDKDAPLEKQVQQSLATSLANLKTTYLDSLVLHSPMRTIEQTMTVWRVFESAVAEGKVIYLGISNCYDLAMLQTIYSQASVKPSFLQNRFYRESGYDKEIRAFCKAEGIHYETFWTLTANPDILKSRTITALAKKYSKTPAQIWFAFIHLSGHMFLTGTQSDEHMAQDLEVPSIVMDEEELAAIAALLE